MAQYCKNETCANSTMQREGFEGGLCDNCYKLEHGGIESLTIKINPTEQGEGGYMYDIYDTTDEEWSDEMLSMDGGQCTTTLLSAIEMAAAQAKDIINRNKAAKK